MTKRVSIAKSQMKRITVQTGGKPGDWRPTFVVEIEEDGSSFTAECKKLDYIACGGTLDEAQHNFKEGLMATAYLHAKMKREGKLKANHGCTICSCTAEGRVTPRFEWRFMGGVAV